MSLKYEPSSEPRALHLTVVGRLFLASPMPRKALRTSIKRRFWKIVSTFGDTCPQLLAMNALSLPQQGGRVPQSASGPESEREFFIDNLLVRIHVIIVMTRWTGLAPWEFEFPFPGSLTSTFLAGGGGTPKRIRAGKRDASRHFLGRSLPQIS